MEQYCDDCGSEMRQNQFNIWVCDNCVHVTKTEYDLLVKAIEKLRKQNEELKAECEKFRSSNRYQRGYHDGENSLNKSTTNHRIDISIALTGLSKNQRM